MRKILTASSHSSRIWQAAAASTWMISLGSAVYVHKSVDNDRWSKCVANSQWHRFYTASVAAPPARLFELLSDMPNYTHWLPSSEQFAQTTAVEPYPVQLGSSYHDGQPNEPGKEWWGNVTGFQPPGSVDFHHTIRVAQLRATVDVHIHYSFEPEDGGTQVNRWLVLDISMPLITQPLRSAIISKFDKENVRTMDAVKKYAEAEARSTRPTRGAERAGIAGPGS